MLSTELIGLMIKNGKNPAKFEFSAQQLDAQKNKFQEKIHEFVHLDNTCEEIMNLLKAYNDKITANQLCIAELEKNIALMDDKMKSLFSDNKTLRDLFEKKCQ